MEILMAEDSLLDARLAMEALRRGEIQHRLTLVRDGEEAIEFLRQQGKFARAPRPDVILLDLLMPKKSGFEVLEEIKGDYDLKGIPVVVMTASDHEEDRAKCDVYEVESFIKKPLKLDSFLQVVKELKRFWLNDVILPSHD